MNKLRIKKDLIPGAVFVVLVWLIMTVALF